MKLYNNEKAIISLTSWLGRIGTTATTIKSLLKQCPEFHIVLVLSEEEFLEKENSLPSDLRKLVKKNKIEILWVKKNYYAFKKVLFTMNKYPDVPIISADDGVIYTENFAEKLYSRWLKHKDCLISTTKYYHKKVKIYSGSGERGILYPPGIFKDFLYLLEDARIIDLHHDDALIAVLAEKLNIHWIFLNYVNLRTEPCIRLEQAEDIGMRRRKLYDDNEAIKALRKILKEYL